MVVGSINMDLVASAEHIPSIGETITGTGFQFHFGGKGANQAVAVAKLGYPVRMIGKVGNDPFGAQLCSQLEKSKVDTSGVAVSPGSSGIALIVVSDRGENTIVVIPGANAAVTPEFLEQKRDIICSAGLVLTQLEIPLETVEYLATICEREKIPLMLDPAPARSLSRSLLESIAWFTPNETEAAHYVGDGADAEESAKRLLEKGLRGVVLKRGGEGSYVAVAGGDARWVKPFKVDAIDTVAAGDCFNGAFAVALLEGNDPWAAARFANAAAAICVTRKGAAASMPMRAEVDEFLQKNP